MLSRIKAMSRATIAIVILAVLLIGAVSFGIYQWRVGHTAGKVAKIEKGQADAGVAAGERALEIRLRTDDLHATTDIVVRGGIENVRSAPGADAPVNPAVRSAAVDGACQLRLYASSPDCAGRLPAPGEGERPAQPDDRNGDPGAR